MKIAVRRYTSKLLKALRVTAVSYTHLFTGSITELCRECGVARSTYYKWLDKPEFTQYVDSLISKFTSSELSTVWKALIRRCSIGDVQAIKLYFEMRRELSSKDESGVQIIDDI